MNNEELQKYIQVELERGAGEESIRVSLKAGGWSDADIQSALSKAVFIHKKAPHFTEETYGIQKPKKMSFLAAIEIIVLFAIFAFFAFSIFYNYIVGDSDTLSGTYTNVPLPTEPLVLQTTSSSPSSSQSSASVVPPKITTITLSTTPTISSDDKDQIGAALLTMKSILETNDPETIRNYLEIRSSASDAQMFRNMTQDQVLSYAAGIEPNYEVLTPEAIISSQTLWTLVDSTTVRVNVYVQGKTIQEVSKKINGVWY